jgi:ParB/RepB/Spo0J family partition protein
MSPKRENRISDKTPAGTRRELWKPDVAQTDSPTGRLTWIMTELIDPNPRQPRKTLDRVALEELKASISQQGILQPLLVVRDKPSKPNVDTRYTLIAGQRRLTAARELGKKLVPVFILSESDPQGSLLNSITENVQRRALAPWEEGESYRVLANEFNMTHAEIAQRLGKNNEAGRVYVAERISIAENLDSEARHILMNLPLSDTLFENSQGVAAATISDFPHNYEYSGELAYGIGVVRELSRIPKERQREAAEAIKALERQLGRKPTTSESIKLLKNYRGEKLFRRGGGALPVPTTLTDKPHPDKVSATIQPALPGLEQVGEKPVKAAPRQNRVSLDELEIIRRWRVDSGKSQKELSREELIALLKQDLEKLESNTGSES